MCAPSEGPALTTTYLDDLLAGARRRVEHASRSEPLEALRDRAREGGVGPSLVGALRAEGVSVIAEVKRASPSRGILSPDLDAATQARAYVEGGAAAVSVLTEPDRFGGSLDDLAAVAALHVPTLRKDFVVDPYQIWEARAAQASAVLLIVAALDEPTLALLHDEAAAAGLDALVEVHDPSELAAAQRVGAELVGINARDLRTFEVDHGAFARLRPGVPAHALAIAESGVHEPADVRRAGHEGADAVLVGEALVRAEDPSAAVAELVAAGREERTPDEPSPPGGPNARARADRAGASDGDPTVPPVDATGQPTTRSIT
jgi:indole-3-glycerol phosphate synthase